MKLPRIVLQIAMVLLPGIAGADEAKTPPLQELLPKVQPTEPNEALKTFRLEKGFRLELAAAEPEVVDPIAMAFDARGRMYVCEDRDYPFGMKQDEPPIGRVRLLEDRNGDGRYEKSTLFADGIHWPSGVACYQGGVFVAAPPQILYLKDNDGDGRADVRRVVFEGFGTDAAEDIMNNLKWGVDNQIYGVASYNGGEVRRADDDGPKQGAVSVRGSSFRFDPRSLHFERLAGTGDFGNCFDDWGNRFVSNAGCLLMHPVLAEPYPDRNPHLIVGNPLYRSAAAKRDMYSISPPEPWRVVRKRFWQRWVNTTHQMRASRFSERELAERGFVTGGAGAAIYRGPRYPAAYRGNSFTAEPAGNVVIRLKLKPNGVTFDALPTSDKREFLASTDNWFRPVNVANGPDGCLYVCDMYREIIEDPSAIPQDILEHVDVTAGRDRGRIYRIVHAGENKAEQEDVRQFVLFDNPTTAALVAALEHPNAWQRETAQRLLVERQDQAAADAIGQILSRSPLPQARLHALWTLAGRGELNDEHLGASLRDDHPALREHAVRLAERRINDSPEIAEAVVALAGDEAPRVRLQAAFTLGQLRDRSAAVDALARIAARDAGDVFVRTAILSSVPHDGGALFARLARDAQFAKSADAAGFLGSLAEMIGTGGEKPDVAAMLGAASAGRLNDEQVFRVVLNLADGLHRSDPDEPFAEHIMQQPQHVRRRMDALFEEARRSAADEQLALDERVQAIRLLPHAGDNHRQTLTSLLDVQHATKIQLAAIQALSSSADREVARELAQRWRGLSPAVRREAAEALLRRKSGALVLLRSIRDGKIPASDLDPARRDALLQHPDEQTRRLAAAVLGKPSTSSRAEVFARLRTCLDLQADPQRGAEVFKAKCATCHAMHGVGKNVGPDLATVQNRSPEQLLLQILDPNREVKPQYVNYVAITDDGRTFSGIIAGETGTSITLRRAEGAEDVLLRRHVEQLRSSGQSIMPEGLEKDIPPQQLADVIAYLKSAPPPPEARAGSR